MNYFFCIPWYKQGENDEPAQTERLVEQHPWRQPWRQGDKATSHCLLHFWSCRWRCLGSGGETQPLWLAFSYVIREATTIPSANKFWGPSLMVAAQYPGKALDSSPALLQCPSFIGRDQGEMILPVI